MKKNQKYVWLFMLAMVILVSSCKREKNGSCLDLEPLYNAWLSANMDTTGIWDMIYEVENQESIYPILKKYDSHLILVDVFFKNMKTNPLSKDEIKSRIINYLILYANSKVLEIKMHNNEILENNIRVGIRPIRADGYEKNPAASVLLMFKFPESPLYRPYIILNSNLNDTIWYNTDYDDFIVHKPANTNKVEGQVYIYSHRFAQWLPYTISFDMNNYQ